MAKQDRVGFVGLGIMGKAQASNILKAGFPLTVYNRTRSKAEELGEMGASIADSPADVARNSDVTITMVSDSPDVEEVILGPGGVIEAAAEGSRRHRYELHITSDHSGYRQSPGREGRQHA